jgi:hypothetical protein
VASSKKAREVEQRAARVERSAWEKTSRKSSGGRRGEQSWSGVDSGQAEVMLGVGAGEYDTKMDVEGRRGMDAKKKGEEMLTCYSCH